MFQLFCKLFFLLCFINLCCSSWVIDWALGRDNCRLKNEFLVDITTTLNREVSGQHIAVPHIIWAVKSHLTDNDPDHALSIVLMGSTGTGKTLVSTLMAEAVLDTNTYVRLFAGRLDFPRDDQVGNYRSWLAQKITDNVKYCSRSIFIFDEVDKIPAGVIDAVKPFLDYHTTVNGVDYRKSIFIFLTNYGGDEINTLYQSLRGVGMARESMGYSHFEKTMRHKLYEDRGLFHNSATISDHLISFFIPFLPLEKEHVIECIQRELKKLALPATHKAVNLVLEKIDFHQDEFSLVGCKRVSDHTRVLRQMYIHRHVEL